MGCLYRFFENDIVDNQALRDEKSIIKLLIFPLKKYEVHQKVTPIL
jgi:hypothetical protein